MPRLMYYAYFVCHTPSAEIGVKNCMQLYVYQFHITIKANGGSLGGPVYWGDRLRLFKLDLFEPTV